MIDTMPQKCLKLLIVTVNVFLLSIALNFNLSSLLFPNYVLITLWIIKTYCSPLLADDVECSSVLLHVHWIGFSCVSCQIAAMLQMNTTATLAARTLAGQLNQN